MITSDELKRIGLRAGADMVGIASAENMANLYPGSDPRNFLKGARSVVISLVADPQAIYDADDRDVYSSLAVTGYRRADGSSAVLMKALKDAGYSVKYIERAQLNEKNAKGKSAKVLQLKHAARAAGLGAQGKHTLIVTEKYSAAVRLSGFITDAPLEADGPFEKTLCDNCDACVRACPSGAIHDVNDFDFFACSAYLFGGVKLKGIAESVTGGDFKTLPESVKELPHVIKGWGNALSGGRQLFYNCGACVRSCKRHKRKQK